MGVRIGKKAVEDNTLVVDVYRKKGKYIGHFRITHFDGYGVLVVGTSQASLAVKILVAVGYYKEEIRTWGYMPTMVNQQASEWPKGRAWGGNRAVGFYFPGVMPGA